MLKDSRKKCPDVKKPNVQVISLCNLCDWFLSYDRCCRFVKLLASCLGLGRWFWFCSGSWVCQPSSLFFYIAEHPLAEWESPGSQSRSCQSHSDLCSNYCPPVGVLGLLKDSVFGAGTLGDWQHQLGLVLQCYRKAAKAEVLGVRRLLRFTKWGLLNCGRFWAGVKILSKDTFRLGEIKTIVFASAGT